MNYAVIGVLLLQLAAHGYAQDIYRTVGVGGQVTFTDKVPADTQQATKLGNAVRPAGASSSIESTLPADLRQASSRYPVFLYTSSNCSPCDSGRALLNRRGIPFTEKTVNTPEDGESLKRISGSNSLPFLSIGGQHIRGFSDSEWTQFLNAADYPATSMLPPNYRNPEARPLISLQKLLPDTKTDELQIQPPPVPGSAPADASNPAGIRF